MTDDLFLLCCWLALVLGFWLALLPLHQRLQRLTDRYLGDHQ